MIIKSHIRGGYRAAADYLKAIGENEKTRLVQISDPDAKNLDEAFHNMWAVASNSRVKKPLHHISINPFKDERLTDEQVLKIVERCEQKYGYKPDDHQRVIIEHIKQGRQHFHVMWNRVSMTTGRAVWPGHHWKKSKQAAREMERELGLKRPIPRRMKQIQVLNAIRNGETSGDTTPTRSPNNFYRARGMYRGLVAGGSTQPSNNSSKQILATMQPEPTNKWPRAAVIDWEVWGHLFPAKFFAKYPELAPINFVPMPPTVK